MYKSKKYSYEYEQIDEEEKSCETIVADILADPEFANLEEVVIGCWGEAWDDGEGAETIINDIIENKEKFAHIKSLFVGDMDFEECEVSWIVQGNYEKLFEAMPQLEKLTIKGSTDLELGKVNAPNLRSLEIICGGLPKEVIQSVRDANLPALKELRLITDLTVRLMISKNYWRSQISLSWRSLAFVTVRFRMKSVRQYWLRNI